MKKFFTDLDISKIKNYRIYLDVDGTLLPHKEAELTDKQKQMLDVLGKNNEVFVVSNKPLPERNRRVAEYAHAISIESDYEKPDIRVIDGIPPTNRLSIVIGDKITTDGMFAWNIDALFLMTLRNRDSQRDLLTKLGDYYDNFMNIFLSPLFHLTSKFYDPDQGL